MPFEMEAHSEETTQTESPIKIEEMYSQETALDCL